MKLFDTHAHLDDARFDPDRAQVIESLRANQVALCMCVGADMDSSRRALDLARQYEFLYAACGIHPHDAKNMQDTDLNTLKAWMAEPKVRAWGEIGLDYYYDLSERDDQRRCFEAQLDAAASIQKPVILHIRDAHGDAYSILKNQINLPRCVVHCYSGSVEMMRQYVALGCYISFTGSITFKNADKLRAVVPLVPDDRIMIETDCPYLAPVPMRGHRNESAYVRYVAQTAAALRETPLEDFCALTYNNGARFFDIPV